MLVVEEIKNASYSPRVGAAIRRLGLRRVMQRLYAILRGNPGHIRLSLNGAQVVFSARTPQELRCVEGAWFGEKKMLSHVLSRVRAGDVFLDVGSNLGLFTVFAAKAVGPGGKVISFEPEAIAHKRLAENIRLNGLHNVQLFKLALSDSRATRKLILGDPDSVSQSSHLADDDGPSEAVETAEYDGLVASQSFPIPSAVKMDIEGHEFAALKGMSATLSHPSCTALFCEVHPYLLPMGVTAGQVVELIQSCGFDSVRQEERATQVHIVATKESATDGKNRDSWGEAG